MKKLKVFNIVFLLSTTCMAQSGYKVLSLVSHYTQSDVYIQEKVNPSDTLIYYPTVGAVQFKNKVYSIEGINGKFFESESQLTDKITLFTLVEPNKYVIILASKYGK